MQPGPDPAVAALLAVDAQFIEVAALVKRYGEIIESTIAYSADNPAFANTQKVHRDLLLIMIELQVQMEGLAADIANNVRVDRSERDAGSINDKSR